MCLASHKWDLGKQFRTLDSDQMPQNVAVSDEDLNCLLTGISVIKKYMYIRHPKIWKLTHPIDSGGEWCSVWVTVTDVEH